jgi:DNA-binding transcriptional LysR family regulator
VADEIASGELVRASERALRIEEAYWLVSPTRAQGLPTVRAFTNWLRAEAAAFKSPADYPLTVSPLEQ